MKGRWREQILELVCPLCASYPRSSCNELKMDLLPEDVRSEILCQLNLNELAACRLVSHSFKSMAEEHTKTVTHVAVDKPEINAYSSNYEDFLSNTLVTANVKMKKIEHCRCPVDGFYSFLTALCPKLQVLCASCSVSFTIDGLAKLPSLRYFQCHELILSSMTNRTWNTYVHKCNH